jgi:subtilisin family serine protease
VAVPRALSGAPPAPRRGRATTATRKALQLMNLPWLMARTPGRPDIRVGVLDGPVAPGLPDLDQSTIREVGVAATCAHSDSLACAHGTFIAGILCGRRGGLAPGICSGCELLVRPIFPEAGFRNGVLPSTTADALAEGITQCVRAGARIINLSSGTQRSSPNAEQRLEQALDHAARHQTVVVAATANRRSVGSSSIIRHAAVLPVIATDLGGRPLERTTLAPTVARRGLAAPGTGVTSLAPDGTATTFTGTSVATALVSGALALLWSEFPSLRAEELKYAVTGGSRRPQSLVPPVLDVRNAHFLAFTDTSNREGQRHA